MASIGIRSRSGERVLTRVFNLGDTYGEAAEVVHEVLTIALTSASRHVVFDGGRGGPPGSTEGAFIAVLILDPSAEGSSLCR